MKVNYEKVFGVHSAFHYCGKPHMLVNITEYLKPAIKNNEMVYICTEEDIYNELIDIFSKTELTYKPLQHYSLEQLIVNHQPGNIKYLGDEIDKLIERALTNGYNGIRIVLQVSYEIKHTSMEQFLRLDKDLSAAIKHKNASVLCLHNFLDYSEDKTMAGNKVFECLLNNHSHILSEFVFRDPKDLYTYDKSTNHHLESNEYLSDD